MTSHFIGIPVHFLKYLQIIGYTVFAFIPSLGDNSSVNLHYLDENSLVSTGESRSFPKLAFDSVFHSQAII